VCVRVGLGCSPQLAKREISNLYDTCFNVESVGFKWKIWASVLVGVKVIETLPPINFCPQLCTSVLLLTSVRKSWCGKSHKKYEITMVKRKRDWGSFTNMSDTQTNNLQKLGQVTKAYRIPDNDCLIIGTRRQVLPTCWKRTRADWAIVSW